MVYSRNSLEQSFHVRVYQRNSPFDTRVYQHIFRLNTQRSTGTALACTRLENKGLPAQLSLKHSLCTKVYQPKPLPPEDNLDVMVCNHNSDLISLNTTVHKYNSPAHNGDTKVTTGHKRVELAQRGIALQKMYVLLKVQQRNSCFYTV